MAVLYIFLLVENILERFIPLINYSDEAITLCMLTWVVFTKRKFLINRSGIRILAFWFVTIGIGLVGNLMFSYQENQMAVAKDILAVSKYFIVYMCSAYFFKRRIREKQYLRICLFSRGYLVVLTVCGCLSQLVDAGMTNDVRFGIKSFRFLYSHPTFLTSAAIIMVTVLYADGLEKNKRYIGLGVGVIALTMRSKGIVYMICMAVFGLALNWSDIGSGIKEFFRKNRLKIVATAAVSVLATFIVLRNKVMAYLSWGMEAARPALYIISFRIVRDCFPLGSGFGTFASYLSTQYLSPLYRIYGINHIYGLDAVSGYEYVTDTYWPYVLAQFGVFGAAAYLSAVYYTIRNTLYKVGKSKDALVAVASLIAYMVASCFVEAMLTNANIVLIALCMGYYLDRKRPISDG